MREVVNETAGFRVSELVPRMIAAMIHIAIATLGFFMARTSLWGGISPLGAAFVAGMPVLYIPASSIGALLGYILSVQSAGGIKYIAALLSVAVIRYILVGIKPVGSKAFWAALTASVIMCGVSLASLGAGVENNAALGIAEGLLAGGGAYFIRKSSFLLIRPQSNLSAEQTASLLIAVNLSLTALYSLTVGGISIGRILAVLVILLASRYGKVGSAAVCGVAAAGSLAIAGQQPQVALMLCFTGLFTGVFSGLSKVAMALSPVAVSGIWVILSAADQTALALLGEAVIAGTLFFIMPKYLSAEIGRVFSAPTQTPDTKGLRKTLTMRLSFASAALRGVSETVEDVARCLAINRKPSFSAVLHEVENEACKGCSFMLHCWERDRKSTNDAVLEMAAAMRRGQSVSLAEVSAEFREKCLRLERFEGAVTKHYSEFMSNISAEKRVGEMREVVSDQLQGIADMLCELSDEFKTAQEYDINMANRVAASLRELDIRAEECSCVIDKYGRMTVEIKLSEMPDLPLNRAKILSRIEEVCDRDFEPPEINRAGRQCYITVTEKAVFTVDAHFTQFNQGENRFCGDTCKFFADGRGRMVAILSDGMGSGGRAAVDSAMTAGLAERLIKAGFGFDCTLRIVNSAMLFKSTEESLATLDISCIDLYNGKAELLKAGAAPTVVRRNGRTGRAECRSLPAGILNEVGFDKAIVTLKEDDIIVMMSDGACTDGTDWICAEIESFSGGGAKQLSEHLATAARRRRHDGHDDDITVFAAIVEKAV